MKILKQKIHYDNERKKTFLIQKFVSRHLSLREAIIKSKYLQDLEKDDNIGYAISFKEFEKIIELE